jgi:hypothetical protein
MILSSFGLRASDQRPAVKTSNRMFTVTAWPSVIQECVAMISAVNVGKVNADLKEREVRLERLKRWQTNLHPAQKTSAADLFGETDSAWLI